MIPYRNHGRRHGPGGSDPVIGVAGGEPGASFEIKVDRDDTLVTVGDERFIFAIPADLDGVELTAVEAFVTTVSSSGTPTVQLRNKTAAVDMLSTKLIIDVGEKNTKDSATAPVINPSNAIVARGDEIVVDVDVAGTGSKGLGVILVFGSPPGGSGLVGPPGPAGADGATGATGATGPAGTAGGIGADGWTAASETWTYASPSTFTVAGDVTAKYQKGTYLKWTQTTVRYGVVASSTHSAGTTTVTIAVNTDYVIANAAITANSYTYLPNPQGWPGWFTFAAAPTGFSALTVDVARFQVVGKTVFLDYAFAGTSNAATFTITLPLTVSAQAVDPNQAVVRVTDNGASTFTGCLRYGSNTTTGTFGKALNAGGGFTSSGTKGSVGYAFYSI